MRFMFNILPWTHFLVHHRQTRNR